MLLPLNGNETTDAPFRIRNERDTGDQLLAVTSPATGPAMLSRTVRRNTGTGTMAMAQAATVPAHGTAAMSPSDLDAIVEVRSPLRVGQRIPFTLRFRDSGRVETAARAVRPSR